MSDPAPSRRYRRILLKLSGESLMGPRQYGIDPDVARDIAAQVAQAREDVPEIAIVVGGGNIFRGLSAAATGMDRSTADYMGMLATVMNGLAIQDALEQSGCPTRVLSAIAMPEICEPYIRRRAVRHRGDPRRRHRAAARHGDVGAAARPRRTPGCSTSAAATRSSSSAG